MEKKNWPNKSSFYKMNYLIRLINIKKRYGSCNSEIFDGFCIEEEFKNIPIRIKVINLEKIQDINKLTVLLIIFITLIERN
jgi:hypothetical protein